jgi:uncharacterized protein YbjT (DUF2867 family)
MRVMVVGASGFIGRRVAGALLTAGHEIVAAVRRVDEIQRIFPGVAVVRCDLSADTTPDVWLPRIKGCDAVVNLAGVLQDKAAREIHVEAPKALYEACHAAGIRRVVHVSAVSADAEVQTEYAATKIAGEQVLKSIDLDWIILRPSLIYGEGSYGGTSLLRGLAGFPIITLLPGAGDQMFQPLHADDLCQVIAASLERRDLVRTTLTPVGPDRVSLANIVAKWRAWLGFPSAPQMRLPMWLMVAGARIGDLLGLAPINTTSLRQLVHGNVASFETYANATGLAPIGFDEALKRRPANVQDRWQARLFFLRLALRFGLAAFWLISGLIGFVAETGIIDQAAAVTGLAAHTIATMALVGCVVDILIGAALLFGWKPILTGFAQIALTLGYPLLLGVFLPHLLFDPLGALVKNLPLLLVVVTFMCLADDR